MSYPQADMNLSATNQEIADILKQQAQKRQRIASGISFTEDEILAYHDECERKAQGA